MLLLVSVVCQQRIEKEIIHLRIWIFLISPTQEIKSVHSVVADLEETDKKFDYEEFFANVEDVFQGAFCQTTRMNYWK